MRTFDFSPLYRSTIGFDHITSLLDSVNQRDQRQPTYPPYNIELLEKDRYRITMAVAGFVEEELEIQIEQTKLAIKGERSSEGATKNYLHHGIAGRNFERTFQLADHVKVTSANLEHGLLHIDLAREIPEAMKPRSISIGSSRDSLLDVRKEKAA